MCSPRVILTLIFIGFIFLIIWNFLGTERFANYLSVADNRDLYVRYLDYLHGGYQIPTYKRMNMGYYIYDIYGFPHFVNYRSDPYILNPHLQDFKGHYFHMPHDRKVIKI